jgi:flavin reductase (DIM6/NTAB) family NADH-FMN oxidoreductase RutF
VPDVDPPRFRQLLGRFATGVAVITTRTPDGRDVGMTANSLSSVSLVPPLVAVNVEREADLHAVLEAASRWVANILAADQEELSRRFAVRGPERFEGIGHRRTATGIAVLDGIVAHLECERWAAYPGGDHTIFVGRVIGGDPGEGSPLLYFRGGYAALGRE